MTWTSKTQPRDLSKAELIFIVDRVRRVLWPSLEPERQWSADTLEAIVEVLHFYDLTPSTAPPEIKSR